MQTALEKCAPVTVELDKLANHPLLKKYGYITTAIVSLNTSAIPYSNFENYLEVYKSNLYIDKEFPCFACDGTGKGFDEKYNEDCESCKGTGETTYEECVVKYEAYLDYIFSEMTEIKNNLQQMIGLLSKLTEEECALLESICEVQSPVIFV